MTDYQSLYGTTQESIIGEEMALGPWSFTFEAGALRHIRLHGVEAIRGIAFLVRDADWGTLSPQFSNVQTKHSNDELVLTYDAHYRTPEAALNVEVSIQATPVGLNVSARGTSTGSFETNRAGFTVLHPIEGVAGQPVTVAHTDGSINHTQFPDLIEPWQPFQRIASLTHQVGNAALTCQFHGDTFEMEDQRQWGDASYKTYNRPLALPWPYTLNDGEILNQSVQLLWKHKTAARAARTQAAVTNPRFAQTALVITHRDALRLAGSPIDVAAVNPQRLLCHFDACLGNADAQFAAFAAAQAACPEITFDMELICTCAPDPSAEFFELAQKMADAGFRPDSILFCPSVDRQSTPPGSDWPECPPLDLIHSLAAQAFPDVTHGGGMVSFFPELNRKRPPVERLDFVSHGLCPIVHAADDVSVMETLQAVPHITRSARAIIGQRSYRIGPASIAMRQNPYGTRTIPNPDNTRVCMAHDDPRHRGQFGAAYVIGLATALVAAEISVWTPAALYGPRGVVSDTTQWPITKALNTLAKCAGKQVQTADISGGLAKLEFENSLVIANLTREKNKGMNPYEWVLENKAG